MTRSTRIGFSVSSCLLLLCIELNSCTSGFMDLDLIKGRAMNLSVPGGDPTYIINGYRKVPSWSFGCSGKLAGLLVCADIEHGTDETAQYPLLLIWRGETVYNRTISLQNGDFSHDGVLEFEFDEPFEFEENDILGVFQPPPSNSAVRIFYHSDENAPYQKMFVDRMGNFNNVTDQYILISPLLTTDSNNSCIKGFPTREDLQRRILNVTIGGIQGKYRQQRIFPDIKFTCNGFITKWIVGIRDRGRGTDISELQIWRNNSILGEKNFVKVNFSFLNFEEAVKSNNVYEYSPDPPLEFQEGDILGIYTPMFNMTRYLVQYQNLTGPLNYAEFNLDPPAPSTFNSTRTQYRYPLVTVSISRVPVRTQIPQRASRRRSIIIGASTGAVVVVVVAIVIVVIAIAIAVIRKRKRKVTLNATSSQHEDHPLTNITNQASNGVENPGNDYSTVDTRKLTLAEMENPLYSDDNSFMLSGEQQQQTTAAIYSEIGTDVLETTLAEMDNPIYSETNDYSSISEAPVKKEQQNLGYKPLNTSAINSKGFYERLRWGVVVPTADQRQRIETHSEDELYSTLNDIHDQSVAGDQDQFFEEEDNYWAPASDSESIYQQLAKRKYREIIRQQIKTYDHLGSGQFGTVDRGMWVSPYGDFEVAVKTLKEGAVEKEKVQFLQEAAIVGQFHHPNIVKLHGVVTLGEPIIIVLELMKLGDLRQYLHSLREQLSSTLLQQLLNYCQQVASGMEYLSKKNFIHRDLAARNILVDDKGQCKIADFGLSRDLQGDSVYISQGGVIPIKWTAPEALDFMKYSTASDVWSFGVLMFEIWSLGHKPFEGKSNPEVQRLIASGHRLAPPTGCSRGVYQLMMQCWDPEPSSRLLFTDLVAKLSHCGTELLEDVNSSVLGEPLEDPCDLHSDLQSLYYVN